MNPPTSPPGHPAEQDARGAVFKYYAFISYSHQDNRQRRAGDPSDAPKRMLWGSWLHNALETYRVPRPFPGEPNKRGEPVPARLVPCFRDEAELPTEARLQTAIEEALRQSRFLIVICSPRSARSIYVNAEVTFFKKLGRGDRILPLIVAGEPNAALGGHNYGFTPEDECFCPGLQHPLRADGTLEESAGEEPICADARSGEAHRELSFGEQHLARATLDGALLKLLAGLLGIAFDDLAQRERQRQIRVRRQRAAMVSAVMTIVLAFALVALWQRHAALAARNEESRQRQLAQRAQQNAEAARNRAIAAKAAAAQLIRYLQYDLHDTLEKLGQLQTLEDINARVRRYYQDHPADPEDQAAIDDADREWSVSLEQQGDILLAKGDLAGALKSYRASLAIREKLVQQDPASVFWQSDLSDSENKVAEALIAQGDLAGALQSYRVGLAIRKKLVQDDPENIDWQLDLSVSDEEIGDVLKTQGDLTGALQSYRASLAILDQLAQKDPTSLAPPAKVWMAVMGKVAQKVPDNATGRRDLSDSLTRLGQALVAPGELPGALESSRARLAIKLGDALLAKGELPGALQSYRASQATREKLAQKDPGNVKSQRELAVSDLMLGDALRAQSDLPGALQSYRASVAIMKQLTEKDPFNADWQFGLSVCDDKVGDALMTQGDLPGALQSYRESVALNEQLAQKDPDNAGWQLVLAISDSNAGDVLKAQGDLPGALQSYRASQAIVEKLVQKDPDNTDWQNNLAASHNRVGDALLAQGDRPGALESYRAFLAICEKFAQKDPLNAKWLHDLALGDLAVGDVLRQQGDLPAALQSYSASLIIHEKLAHKDPTNAAWQLDLAVNYERVGGLAQLQKRWAEAAAALRHEVEIARPRSTGDDAEVAWLSLFTVGAGRCWELLRDAPAGAVPIDRAAALADLRTARERLQKLKEHDRLIPPMDKKLPWIERLIQAAEQPQNTPGSTPKERVR